MKSSNTLVSILRMFGTKFEVKLFITTHTNKKDMHWVLMEGEEPIYTMELLNETWALLPVYNHADELSNMYPNIPFVELEEVDVVIRNLIHTLSCIE
jgi:hypothetical protein